MNCITQRVTAAGLVAVACLAGPVGAVRADDTEYRDYVIFVDDREAGQSRITLVEKSDGTTNVTVRAKVQVKVLLITAFAYEVDLSETWKQGKLVTLSSTATEDGKKTKVHAYRSGEQLLVRVNDGSPAGVRADAWTSSYWKLADARYHNHPVPVLDSDTGRELSGQLDYVGTEKLKIGGKLEDCYRFHVGGIPVPIELWFDKYHRLVRQQFTEDGHRTIMQLLAVRR